MKDQIEQILGYSVMGVGHAKHNEVVNHTLNNLLNAANQYNLNVTTVYGDEGMTIYPTNLQSTILLSGEVPPPRTPETGIYEGLKGVYEFVEDKERNIVRATINGSEYVEMSILWNKSKED